jgi:hypothetical protein
MKMQRTIILFFLLMSGICGAQTSQVLRNQVYQAEKNKDWYAAAQYYQRIYEIDSNNVKVLYRYAEACRLSYDLDMALRLYYKLARVDNGRKYPLVPYWVGQILKNKQQYKQAKLWFAKFNKQEIKARRARNINVPYYKVKAKLETEACDLAQIYMMKPVMAEPDHLDLTVNSKLSEYAPVERDSALYFSSIRLPDRKVVKDDDGNVIPEPERPYYSKIYKSEIRREKLKKIKALDTAFNSNVFHSANVAFSPDGKTMIITRCAALNESDKRCELFQSKLLKTRWLAPVKMDEPINQPSVSTTQPHFSTLDGRTVLFFASDRPGGEGGLDIWYSFQNEGGSFSEPVNAGKNINTPDDEVSPWYIPDKGLLYFSSTYHKGLGGYDIFKSKYAEGRFAEPENAGYPVNSSHHDTYFSMNQAGNHMYISSNRVGSFFETKLNCCSDIYRFTVDTSKIRPPAPVDTAFIVKEQLKLLVPLTLYFHNDEPEPRTTVTVTAKNYEATYNEYKALAPEYLREYTAGLKGSQKDLASNGIDIFFRDSVDAGIEQLKQFSDLLEKVLRNGETVRITMKGYCSPLASTNYNINLAKRRISSLRNYFMQTRDGLFMKYINEKDSAAPKIILEDVDIGELPASKVSDNFRDKRNSVYSPFAASERKIQIIAISYGRKP